jgi:hypothetical protein
MEKLTFDKDVQFHLLRHFSKLDKNFLEEFSRKSIYDRRAIEEQLEYAGSKFHYDFANNPQVLCEILNSYILNGDYFTSNLPERKLISFQFDHDTYPDGIGTNNIISIDKLSQAQLQTVKESVRGEYTIRTIDDIPPQNTWEVHVILLKNIDYNISTVFPGIYAPPFPSKDSQTLHEFNNSTTFWNIHALIKE